MTLEQRGERLVISWLPVEQMGFLALGLPVDEQVSTVITTLLQGGTVTMTPQAPEYKGFRKTAPQGVYQKFMGLERQLREMGIGRERSC